MRQIPKGMFKRLWRLVILSSAVIACSGSPQPPSMTPQEAVTIARTGAIPFTEIDLKTSPSNAFEDEKVWLVDWLEGGPPPRHVTVVVDKTDKAVLITFPNSCLAGACGASGVRAGLSEQEALAIAREQNPESPLIQHPPVGSWQSEKAWAFYWEPLEDTCGGDAKVVVDKRSREALGPWGSQ